jgi:predicted enzyme related to lactoylglutathione lyase
VAFWFVETTEALAMKLSMRRIVLFTNDMARMVSFYRDVLGLSVCKDERGWKEFDANGCVIALHNGTSQVGKRPPKIGFWSEDVAAARQMLVARGARLGKVMSGSGLIRCEGKDPDGNPFSISNRA